MKAVAIVKEKKSTSSWLSAVVLIDGEFISAAVNFEGNQ
jgi:hypothetical protein